MRAQLYSIRNGELQQTIIQLESPAVGLVRMNKNVMVGAWVRHGGMRTGRMEERRV
jgi:hypothetical protein